MDWSFKGELKAVGPYIQKSISHVFYNYGEFVTESSVSLDTVNDLTYLICDEPKIRDFYTEQHDFLKLIMQSTHYGCA